MSTKRKSDPGARSEPSPLGRGGSGRVTGIRQCIRLTVGFVGATLFFWMILLGHKGVFLCYNLRALSRTGHGAIADALWRGLRIEAAALALLLGPLSFLFWGAATTGW